MTEIEKAWLACAIDGEGSISLYKHPRKFKIPRPFARPYSWKVQIKVSNSNVAFCEQAAKIAGYGIVHLQVRENPQRNKVAAWAWHCTPRGVISVLEDIMPYLIIKRKQAELAIYARRLQMEHIITSHNDGRLQLIKEELNKLNKHGLDTGMEVI